MDNEANQRQMTQLVEAINEFKRAEHKKNEAQTALNEKTNKLKVLAQANGTDPAEVLRTAMERLGHLQFAESLKDL